MVEINKVPTQEEFEEAQECGTDLDKMVIKLAELNELAQKDLILSIRTSSTVGKVVFGLVKNAKSLEYPKGNCKVQDQLVNNYALHTDTFLLKLKNEFHNRKLDQWRKIGQLDLIFGRTSNLNEQIRSKSNISDEDLMIHVLNNLP